MHNFMYEEVSHFTELDDKSSKTKVIASNSFETELQIMHSPCIPIQCNTLLNQGHYVTHRSLIKQLL